MPVLLFVLASDTGAGLDWNPPGDQVAIEVFPDVPALLARLHRQPPDLVLLRHAPGDRRVLEALRALRAVSDLPCVLQPAGADESELRILAFEAGADDWLPASTTPREILGRIGAVLRRSGPRSGPAMHGWRLSVARRELYTPGGARCHLTAAEFRLLELLVRSRQAVNRDELSQMVCRRAYFPGDRAIDGLVMRLRRKLEGEGDEPVIKAVRGVGYAFVGFPERGPETAQEPCSHCGKLQFNPGLEFPA